VDVKGAVGVQEEEFGRPVAADVGDLDAWGVMARQPGALARARRDSDVSLEAPEPHGIEPIGSDVTGGGDDQLLVAVAVEVGGDQASAAVVGEAEIDRDDQRADGGIFLGGGRGRKEENGPDRNERAQEEAMRRRQAELIHLLEG